MIHVVGAILECENCNIVRLASIQDKTQRVPLNVEFVEKFEL